jgi:hypothetical protein
MFETLHHDNEAREALQHLQFQMSLLRLTALPAQMRGAEALALRQQASSADVQLEELSHAAMHLAKAS